MDLKVGVWNPGIPVGVWNPRITTSTGRSKTFGGPGGTDEIELVAPDGREIDGFFGNSNNCLTRLGLLTRPFKPTMQ
jgi:Jacalin-like lectin domain